MQEVLSRPDDSNLPLKEKEFYELQIDDWAETYPKQIFTILVWGEDRQKVGELPREGSRVCATGMIQDYRGVPEIVVKSSAQFSK